MKAPFVVIPLLALFLAGAATPRKDSKEDRQKLQGNWTATAIEFHGRPALGDAVKDLQLEIAGDNMTLKGEGPDLDKYARFTWKLDPTATPKIIDITLTAGADKGAVLEGIYELKNDEWKLCVTVFGKDRPKEFKSSADSHSVVAVFKRSEP